MRRAAAESRSTAVVVVTVTATVTVTAGMPSRAIEGGQYRGRHGHFCRCPSVGGGPTVAWGRAGVGPRARETMIVHTIGAQEEAPLGTNVWAEHKGTQVILICIGHYTIYVAYTP